MKRWWMAAALSLLCGGSAWAQYLDYAVGQRAHFEPGSRVTARLMGMGGLAAVIEDENNELNLIDFGRNLAGIADDRDGWSVEGWGRRSRDVDEYRIMGQGDRYRYRVSRERSGIDAAWRGGGKTYGLTVLWDRLKTADPAGDGTNVRGPSVSAYAGGVLGPVRWGAGIGGWTDDQFYPLQIAHAATGWVYSLGLAADPGAWTIGAQLAVDDVSIDGESKDPEGYHRDEYTWSRPATSLRLSLLRERSARLGLGLNCTFLRREGIEEASISWSDRYPYNPSDRGFTTTVPTFEEEESGLLLEGRMRYRWTDALQSALFSTLETFDVKVEDSANTNFPGSLRAEDSDGWIWTGGGGMGCRLLGGRAHAGVEGLYTQGNLESIEEGVSTSTDWRVVEARAGVEVLFRSRLALRGGGTFGVRDEDVDAPSNLYNIRSLTIGLGYIPLGGTIVLDGALVWGWWKPDYEASIEAERETTAAAVSARFLF